jgi:hypothetical protein
LLLQCRAFLPHFLEPTGNEDYCLDAAFPAGFHSFQRMACRDDNFRQVNGVRHISNLRVTTQPKNFIRTGVDRVNSAGIAVFLEVLENAITQLLWIGGSADDGNAGRGEKRAEG